MDAFKETVISGEIARMLGWFLEEGKETWYKNHNNNVVKTFDTDKWHPLRNYEQLMLAIDFIESLPDKAMPNDSSHEEAHIGEISFNKHGGLIVVTYWKVKGGINNVGNKRESWFIAVYHFAEWYNLHKELFDHSKHKKKETSK